MRTTNKILVTALILLALAPMALGALTDDLAAYYTFDNTLNDAISSSVASGTAVPNSTGIVNTSYHYLASGTQWLTLPTNITNASGSTQQLWLHADKWDTSGDFVISDNDVGNSMYFQMTTSGGLIVAIRDQAGPAWRSTTVNGFTTGTDYQLILLHNTTGAYLYVNGVLNATVYTGTFSKGMNTGNVTLGAHASKTVNNIDGLIDDYAEWNRGITPAEITELYNSGAGCAYPFTSCAVNNFTITATDAYTTSAISTFNITVDYNGTSTEYSTTSGSITTNIAETTNRTINITTTSIQYFTNFTTWNNSGNPYAITLYRYTAITAKDGTDNSTLSNFTINYNATNYTTTNGTAYIPLYATSNANVTIYPEQNYNYESDLLTASDYLENYTFTVYPDPSSVGVTLYDQATGNTITQNITLTVSGTSYEETYTTITGAIFVSDLTAGTYSFKFSGANYTTQTYLLTVGAYTYQTLNAFLATNTSSVTFTVQDYDSNAQIEGATVTQQRLINNAWTTISSKESDITGRAQFEYVQNVKYRFITTNDDYQTKTFELDPVIFTAYTIRITRTVTQTDNTNYANILWDISPTTYEDNQTYNLSVTIISANGALETYGFIAEYPGDGPKTASGNNANGETLTITINITGAQLQDTVNVTFWYDTTQTDNVSYSRHYIIIPIATAGTFQDNSATDYGFTLFEKVLLASMAIIVIAGFAFLITGPLGGGIVTLVMLAWFYKIGFLTLWLILPSILIGLMLIYWRATE